MPTITITGYNFGGSEPINLTVTYYIYHDEGDPGIVSKFYFYYPSISPYGSYTPVVQLANEGGKVILYINGRSYYQRFTISAYAYGMLQGMIMFQKQFKLPSHEEIENYIKKIYQHYRKLFLQAKLKKMELI